MTPKLYTIIYIKSIKKLREKDENEKKVDGEKKGDGGKREKGDGGKREKGTEENSHFWEKGTDLTSYTIYVWIIRSVPFSQKWEFSSVPFSRFPPAPFLAVPFSHFPPSTFPRQSLINLYYPTTIRREYLACNVVSFVGC